MPSIKQAIFAAIGALLVAACAWWWFDTMEKRWVAAPYRSDAARENPMLAATRLLSQHGYTVTTQSTLSHAMLDPLPNGTLILADNGGIVTAAQAKQLLDWVKRGNTLIARPKWASRSRAVQETGQADGERTAQPAAVENDPIGAHLGVFLTTRPYRSGPAHRSGTGDEDEDDEPEGRGEDQNNKAEDEQEQDIRITLPNGTYPLYLYDGSSRLWSPVQRTSPLFGDDAGAAVRVYPEGKGRIVMLAESYFVNRHLERYDHAELLLGLAQLRPAAKEVIIVQRLTMLTWYEALWAGFKLAIVSAACVLALLFWMAVRRFGPLLPEPDRNRRSLIEHIDASARWLWKVPGGRDILLAAARMATDRILQRRVPELHGLSPAEQIAYLAQNCRLAAVRLKNALHQPASRVPIEFTRQIQTLQQLRKHYER